MLAVTVDFRVDPRHAGDFRREVLANARASLRDEPGCRQFDVCVAPDDPAQVFLYELYDDRAAFDAHLRTAHFVAFDAASAGWVASKVVRLLERVGPA